MTKEKQNGHWGSCNRVTAGVIYDTAARGYRLTGLCRTKQGREARCPYTPPCSQGRDEDEWTQTQKERNLIKHE